MRRKTVYACSALLFCALASYGWVANTAHAQDEDPLVKEMLRKKKRDKAIREGKDPDAVDKPKPKKVELPDDADGWIRAIKKHWEADGSEEQKAYKHSIQRLRDSVQGKPELKDDVKSEFEEFKEKAAQDALKAAITKSGVSVDKLRRVLKENRPKALRAIMNPAYTESDNCRLQPEVDKACAPLFGVWNDPVGYAMEHMDLSLAASTQLDALATDLGRIVEVLGEWPDGASSAEDYMRKLGALELNVKEKEYKGARGTLEANKKVKTGKYFTEEDRKHVAVLNDYRLMLGKGAVKINLTLCEAATRHSQYMKKVGRIGHNMQGHPDGVTPQDRAKRAGFGGSVAENCLMGAGDGATAVWQWYRAAEHHRNMIAGHSVIGVGHAGTYWTQNFSGGGGRPGRGR